MKKLLLLSIIAIAFICQQSSAQIKKGETMLGLSLGFSTTKLEQESSGVTQEAKVRVFQIAPDFGVGLGNNWIAGIRAGYSHTKQDGEAAVHYVSKGVSGGVFVRKFYPVGSGRFGIFGQGNVQYAHNSIEYPSNYKAKNDMISVSIQPGAYVRASKRFIVEALVGNIGYAHSVLKPNEGAGPGKAITDSFVFSLSNNLALGFKIVL